ncbi:MAG: glycogen/starch synthase [Acidimicrobiales bacterium]|nr:glycogen/starch synthase [Acidimicrobiales bacterium]
MHVLFATAELAPIVKVGGLGEASCGLVRALRDAGHRVDVVIPDYGPNERERGNGPSHPVAVPSWAAPAWVRTFELDDLGVVHAVAVPGMARHHPYVHAGTGQGWADNDRRFFAFSAAVAALAAAMRPDVVHLNDWHTAAALAFLDDAVPTVFTVHNLAHQGWADHGWLEVFGERAAAFNHDGDCNPMAGAIRLADRVVAVSPNYALEIQRAEHGEGLDPLLAARSATVVGIRNGIDTGRWNPATDELLPANYSSRELHGREVCNKELRRVTGFDSDDQPVIGVVARLVEQKGIDVAVACAPLLGAMPARMVLVGDGDPALRALAEQAASQYADRFFVAPYSDALAHLVVAGSDVMLVPSRFEPCGLTQMESMAYGTVPVVTGVGGLRDTVIDADACPGRGNGFVADVVDPMHLVDALHRALRASRNKRRWQAIQRRGMTADWSWEHPAADHVALYRDLLASG